MKHPKVLILNQPFNHTGGGITMTNLFEGWDKDRIAVVCTGHLLASNVNTAPCELYYQLGEKEQKLIFPFNFLQRKFISGAVQIKPDQSKKQVAPDSKSMRYLLVNKILYPALEYAGLFHSLSRIKLSPSLCEWLKEYNPDIIYAQAFNPEGVQFCITVQEYLKKPMAFHMMDDWPATIGKKGLFRKYWFKKVDAGFRNLLNHSSLLMAISADMADEYKRRYSKKFIAFHNPLNIEFWKRKQRTQYALNNAPTVLYAGRIGLGIEASLKLIARAIHDINAELKLAVKFVLRTEDKLSWMNDYDCVEHRPYATYSEMPGILSGADLLMLPYDFSDESIRFIKYSMPTKATEYMISGTPIIVFAPAETAIVNYAVKYNCFEIVTENKLETLSASIKHLIQDPAARQQLGEKAKNIAETHHASDIVTKQFREALLTLCSKAVPEKILI